MTAWRIDSDWTVTTEEGLTRDAEGDVQVTVLALGRRGYSGRELRLVNSYHQGTDRERRDRGAMKARWDEILLEDCVLAGDFNAHSPIWNPQCTRSQRRDATFLEELVETHELVVKNNGQATRPASMCHSVIDLILATPNAAPFCKEWRTLDSEEHATGSDHVMIEWKWTKPVPKVDKSWKVQDWALKERLDKEKEEEWPSEKPKLEVL